MTEIDSTSTFTVIVSSVVSVLTAVGGLECIKFVVKQIQSKHKRKIKDTGDTVDFYKRELDELQSRYKEQEQRLNDLQKQVIELNQKIANQAATIAEMRAQLQIYKCITLECPYRNKGYPQGDKVLMQYGTQPKKPKAKKDKEDTKNDEG